MPSCFCTLARSVASPWNISIIVSIILRFLLCCILHSVKVERRVLGVPDLTRTYSRAPFDGCVDFWFSHRCNVWVGFRSNSSSHFWSYLPWLDSGSPLAPTGVLEKPE